MKVSVLINSRNRLQPLLKCLESVISQNYPDYEVIVLDDASDTTDLCPMILDIFKSRSLFCFRSEIQLGVAGSRNLMAELATGDVFCFIDDDAYFESFDAIIKFVRTFDIHEKIGIVACKVVNHYENFIHLSVPFSLRWRHRRPDIVDRGQFVSYYLGTCHAIKREVFERCGFYNSDMMFGGEELDLSYRAIDAGYYIYYEPSIVVHHYPQISVVGSGDRRQRDSEELYYSLRNRFYLAYRYLPLRYVPSYLSIWIGYYLYEALRRDCLSVFFRGVWDGIQQLKKHHRTPLNNKAKSYLKEHYGRLWY